MILRFCNIVEGQANYVLVLRSVVGHHNHFFKEQQKMIPKILIDLAELLCYSTQSAQRTRKIICFFKKMFTNNF